MGRMTMSGTQEGVSDGQTGTGQRFLVDEVDICTVVDARIASYRVGCDGLSPYPGSLSAEPPCRTRDVLRWLGTPAPDSAVWRPMSRVAPLRGLELRRHRA